MLTIIKIIPMIDFNQDNDVNGNEAKKKKKRTHETRIMIENAVQVVLLLRGEFCFSNCGSYVLSFLLTWQKVPGVTII